MTEPTKEQIQALWVWCGFSKVDYTEVSPIRYGDYSHVQCFFEYPQIDLNNLFKYAVPKLANQYRNSIEIKVLVPVKSAPNFWVVDITNQHKHVCSGNSKDINNPALALFWAIWEVIK